MNKLERSERQRPRNRIAAVMVHTSRYAFKGRSRLATDSGVSKSAITRLLKGQSNPSYRLVARIAKALEEQLGKRLDPRELVSEDGEYPTHFVCRLVDCKGCLPNEAFTEDGQRSKGYEDVKPGFWTGDIEEARHQKWQPIPEIQ